MTHTHKVIWHFYRVFLWDHETWNLSIHCNAASIATKRDNLMTYVKPLSPTELLRSECLWPPTVTGWWLTFRGFYPLSQITLWSCGLVGSYDKLKPLHLQCHSTYGHQAWQYEDLYWVVPPISLLCLECLWLSNLARWWLTFSGSYP